MPTVTLPTPASISTSTKRVSIAWPSLLETVLAAAAIVAIVPGFARLGNEDTGRDHRFADAALAVDALPAPILKTLCATHARLAEPQVRERLCGRIDHAPRTGGEALPPIFPETHRRIAVAFDKPLKAAEARLAELRRQQREGTGDPLPSGTIESLDAEVQAFAQRYALDASGDSGPRPLACAFEHVAAATRSPNRASDERSAPAAANALLLLAAAMDGDSRTGIVAASAALPASSPTRRTGCRSLSLSEALAQGSLLMADARRADLLRAKNDAMRELLTSAGWQWAGWMLAGLVLVKLSRTRLPAAVGVSLALATWAGAAWAGRVPWPLAHDRTFEVGRLEARWDAMPAGFVTALLATAAVVLAVSPWLRRPLAPVPQTLASRVGYPGFVATTGVGWLLLLDLSTNGPPGNRYLALYHHGHLWLAMLVLTVLAFLRPTLGRALAWLLSVSDELGGRIGRMLGPSSRLAPSCFWWSSSSGSPARCSRASGS